MEQVYPQSGRSLKPRATLVFLAFAAIAVALLWQDHSAHLLGIIPWLFLLACPLAHVFMHRGHGAQRQQPSAQRPSTDTEG
ncbi:DUF2933 domain-containing protein [Hyphomicrobium sp.]|uniref:DUF2933 domain-containing protein n=1 Tax=Hyphomicrobium sp. TaxID=82 RepID=UPI000FA69B0D|nr:DUF2933 domain-containing protein [Hyphomicrobium sp.]RUO98579.1 MAG: DUF2933 domain-containing protein [Hyphomicrobium sp.]